jgi:hypothetical protein
MKRLLALAPAALVVLAGCGADTCSSKPAQVAQIAPCSVAPGATVAVPVQLCGHCTDSSPTCQAEFLNNQFEFAPVFQECQEQRGCPVDPACANAPVTCTVTAPTTPGSYPVIDASTTQQVGTIDVAAGGTGC